MPAPFTCLLDPGTVGSHMATCVFLVDELSPRMLDHSQYRAAWCYHACGQCLDCEPDVGSLLRVVYPHPHECTILRRWALINAQVCLTRLLSGCHSMIGLAQHRAWDVRVPLVCPS